MDDATAKARMWGDLLRTETRARDAVHEATARAELYLHAGLPLDRVLDALGGISRATWYRRLESLRTWETGNRSEAEEVDAPTEEPKIASKDEKKSAPKVKVKVNWTEYPSNPDDNLDPIVIPGMK